MIGKKVIATVIQVIGQETVHVQRAANSVLHHRWSWIQLHTCMSQPLWGANQCRTIRVVGDVSCYACLSRARLTTLKSMKIAADKYPQLLPCKVLEVKTEELEIQASRIDTGWTASNTICTCNKATVQIKTVNAYKQMCWHKGIQSVIQQMLGCVKIIVRLLFTFIWRELKWNNKSTLMCCSLSPSLSLSQSLLLIVTIFSFFFSSLSPISCGQIFNFISRN